MPLWGWVTLVHHLRRRRRHTTGVVSLFATLSLYTLRSVIPPCIPDLHCTFSPHTTHHTQGTVGSVGLVVLTVGSLHGTTLSFLTNMLRTRRAKYRMHGRLLRPNLPNRWCRRRLRGWVPFLPGPSVVEIVVLFVEVAVSRKRCAKECKEADTLQIKVRSTVGPPPPRAE
jgi:hypothetical protein